MRRTQTLLSVWRAGTKRELPYCRKSTPIFTASAIICHHCAVLQAVDVEHLSASFAASQAAERAAGSAEAAQPLQDADVQCIDAITDGQELRWIQTGFRLVAEVDPSVVLSFGCHHVTCGLPGSLLVKLIAYVIL